MDNSVILGSGVQLETKAVSFPARALAFIIDIVALLLFLLLLMWLTSDIISGMDSALFQATAIVTVVIALVIWPTTVETLTRGRSLGKWAVGLRIVRDDGGPINFRHSLIRHLVGVGELWMTSGVVATITSFVNGQGKRVGDYLAGTYCLRVRFKRSRPLDLTMPPQLQEWSERVIIRRLDDNLLLQTQRFLQRVGELSPAAREHMSIRLANAARAYVSDVPANTDPIQFLQAVTVLHRDLEETNVQRQQDLEDEFYRKIEQLPFDRVS